MFILDRPQDKNIKIVVFNLNRLRFYFLFIIFLFIFYKYLVKFAHIPTVQIDRT